MKAPPQILLVTALLAAICIGLFYVMQDASLAITSDKKNIGNLAHSHFPTVMRPIKGCSDTVELQRIYNLAHTDKGDIATIRAKAELNDPCAQYYLARLTPAPEKGKWQEAAFSQFRIAAEKGSSDAQYNLGLFATYKPRNPEEMEKWWAASAKQENPYAQFELGKFYYREGVELGGEDSKETQRAYPLLLGAAEQGHVGAMHLLGNAHNAPSRRKPDYPVAADWYLKAAERGYTPGQMHIGYMYQRGQGVNQDWKKAYFWGCLAAKCFDGEAPLVERFGGAPDSQSYLEAKHHLSIEEITEIEKSAREWEPVVPPSP